MSDRKPPRAPMAGGFVLAMCAMAGAIGGAFLHQSSLGLLIGLGVGGLIALAIWLRERKR